MGKLCCVLGHDTLLTRSASLHAGIQMDTSKLNTGVASIPPCRESKYSWWFHVIETAISSGLVGPSGSHTDFTFLHDYEYILLVGL